MLGTVKDQKQSADGPIAPATARLEGIMHSGPDDQFGLPYPKL